MLLRIRRCRIFRLLSIFFVAFSSFDLIAQEDGRVLFQNNCASCHAVNKELTGPALQGIRQRVTDEALLHAWIRNSKKVLADGDPYFTELYNKWNKVAMNTFPSLTDAEIKAILDYVDQRSAELAKATPAQTGVGGSEKIAGQDTEDTYLYIIVLAFVLLLLYVFKKINTNLSKAIAEKRKIDYTPPTPIYRDKRYIALAVVILFTIVGVVLADEGMSLGIQQNYQPIQPIFFSHRVHAGVNKIDCQYCHSTARNSKHALIPTVNVCMNCHKAINEYTGGLTLKDEEGNIIDGTSEIKKLYEYANFKPGQVWSAENGNKPIEWVRIHNLPDHVKFNHSQHVVVGKQECQTCHGQVQEMDEVYQYNTLAMGWCVNCHRTTEVQFASNKFYDMYKGLHKDLAEGKIDKVTVESIGGTECQKCHY